MNKEIQALEHNNTWSIAALPPHAHAIDCKWIFRIKYNSDGTIERYKARVVAKGYTQVEGIDYHDTFAPVAKMTTVRCLLAIAATKQWPVFQLDVDNAFLHGDLQEEVYMLTPPGFYSAEKQQGLVCKLHKSIYGLKQASRQWFSRFSDSLLAFGFQQSLEDYSLFTLKKDNHFIILLVYVDDVVLTGTSPSLINQIKEFIHAKFRIKDLGHLKYFLGIEVARSKEGIFINQRKYALDILAEHSFTDSKPVQTPLETKHGLSKSNSEPISDPTIYRKLVGKLIYLTITRPDLAFAVHTLSQFMATPTVDHLKATHRLLRYIKLAPAQGILFSATSNLRLTGYCDADWASCPITHRSVTGYCMLLGSSVVSWKTRKQAVVSRSSAESEYRFMASACSEIVAASHKLLLLSKFYRNFSGFLSMAIELDKNQLVITGVGIDTATVATSLTKKVGYTSIVSVEIVLTEAQKKEAEEKKKKEAEEKKKKEAEEKKKKEAEEAAKNRCVTWSYNPCNNYAPPPPPPGCDIICYSAPTYPNTWFTW
ncbi:unnamed protein product [Rhodiola kirilowii]